MPGIETQHCSISSSEDLMFRKSLLSVLFLFTITFFSSAAAAQAISGVVELETSGSRAPLAGAKVDLYREDVKGKGQSVTTGPDGKFSFASVETGKSYLLSVSAPGASPTYLPGIKAGMRDVSITMESGDGRNVTEDALKNAIATAAGKMSEEEKKKQAEFEKKRQEIAANNKRIEESGKIIDAAMKDGKAAFDAKNYDVAVAKYEEGYAASPDYEGTAPVLLNNKAISLRTRANALIVAAQKGTVGEKSAAKAQAALDYALAITSIERGLEVIAKAPATSPAKDALPVKKKDLYSNYVETLAQMYQSSIPVAESTDAAKALAGYLDTETDPKRQTAVLISFGDKALRGGAVKASAMAYKKILETNPKDLDALSGATVALGALAFTDVPPAEALMQEASKYGKQFLDSAPKDHKNHDAVVNIMDTIKDQASSKNN